MVHVIDIIYFSRDIEYKTYIMWSNKIMIFNLTSS
jgi:hypothetical protein